MPVRDEDVAQLVCMGFPEEQARNALQTTAGNLEMAVNLLLSGEAIGSAGNENGALLSPTAIPAVPVATESPAAVVIKGSSSQYSHGPDGRSACTCIALTAADILASSCTAKSRDSDEQTSITTSFLNRAIEEGVSRYRILRRRCDAGGGSNSSIEHLSAEEVLLKDEQGAAPEGKHLFGVRVVAIGGGLGVRQGALSRDPGHPLGLPSVLNGLVGDVREQRKREWNQTGNTNGSANGRPSPMIYILMTKSPETVLLCLPCDDCKKVNEKGRYWLVDSHPRPHLFQRAEHAYAKPHDTMDSLLQSLRCIFPLTDLGPDIPPMMADMYNMFDLYALEVRA